MRVSSQHATGLRRHFTVYSTVDAGMDHPHVPSRDLPAIVRASRMEADHILPERYIPLRERLSKKTG